MLINHPTDGATCGLTLSPLIVEIKNKKIGGGPNFFLSSLSRSNTVVTNNKTRYC